MKKGMESLVSALELPQDLCLGAAVITALGCRELTIENHKGILEYGPECIRVLSGMCRIKITGSDLVISYFNREAMKIEGRIREIIYE
ncbi:YabP/YqfC family sporulation protein [Lacrimispora sp. NSJ-141]|uniref:YabP/YqfC family sporulation protein n=1 Tax=Lientehia hominis TaxID=2897778 RepID=A0AAP2RF39_9FIRM|nr:YabP/YqfC family sporulation protein [Lientehia hominis]MCD2491024.1 YabP/YqfC family sporulation protein [Lientehia hominis]